MTMENAGHNSRELASGETVHLLRHRDGKWRVDSYEWSYTNGLMLWTATLFAQALG